VKAQILIWLLELTPMSEANREFHMKAQILIWLLELTPMSKVNIAFQIIII